MFILNVLRELLAALADTVHNAHLALHVEFAVHTGDLSGHLRTWWTTCVRKDASANQTALQSDDDSTNGLVGQTAYIPSRGCAAAVCYPTGIEGYYALDLAGGERVVHHIADLELEQAQ